MSIHIECSLALFFAWRYILSFLALWNPINSNTDYISMTEQLAKILSDKDIQQRPILIKKNNNKIK